MLKKFRRTKKIYDKCNAEKKYRRQIQHPITDFKMDLHAKVVNKVVIYFRKKKHHFGFVTGSEFACVYHKSNVSYEQQKSYIPIFWNVGSYYLAEFLVDQSQQKKH